MRTTALLFAVLSVPTIAQQRPAARPQAVTPTAYESRQSTQLRFRHLGPVGNRVSAVVGVPGDPSVYYAGAASLEEAGFVTRSEDEESAA